MHTRKGESVIAFQRFAQRRQRIRRLVNMGQTVGQHHAGNIKAAERTICRNQWLVAADMRTLHGEPVTVTGRVRSIAEGTYEEPRPTHGGWRFFDGGTTAALDGLTGTGGTYSAPRLGG